MSDQAETKLVKFGELSRQTGLTRQALHQYVVLGILVPESATKGGQRLFVESAALARIQLIQNLLANGYTLQSIRDIFFRDKN